MSSYPFLVLPTRPPSCYTATRLLHHEPPLAPFPFLLLHHQFRLNTIIILAALLLQHQLPLPPSSFFLLHHQPHLPPSSFFLQCYFSINFLSLSPPSPSCPSLRLVPPQPPTSCSCILLLATMLLHHHPSFSSALRRTPTDRSAPATTSHTLTESMAAVTIANIMIQLLIWASRATHATG